MSDHLNPDKKPGTAFTAMPGFLFLAAAILTEIINSRRSNK
ncbi:Uncharacterised protein [Paucimonas lemoignei]|nr:Uncharacterised protein [Paucimonas lemoignei]